MHPPNNNKLKEDIVFSTELRGIPMTFHSTWGLFSPREVDEGSRLLSDHIEVTPNDDILEIGCGYGPIGLTLAKLATQGSAHLVDKDFVAVEYTKKNAELNHIENCETYLSNGLSLVPNQQFDLIVSNLPAKAGNEFYTVLFHDAKTHLSPGGRLCVVTLSGLREYIKRSFKEIFGNYTKIKQGARYTVSMTMQATYD
jgi:16S rRNA G1207 methylase RsmC